MTTVKINGKTVRLSNNDVIGMGGEATVFKHRGQAVKVYTQADATRDQKLRAMLSRAAVLPNEVIAPQELVLKSRGKQAVGFTMRLLDANYTEARQLAVKKYRAKAGLTARDIAQLFLSAYYTLDCIHRAGMVVGDFNDLNLMFKDGEMVFIDADSFQFDSYPCMVGTEAFLDPSLYGKDLSQKAFFKPENDWYSFAVLLFKSLLLAHPYGGIHPSINLMTQRAQQGVSVFHSRVKYPRIAYSPDLLSDDLAHEFDKWFSKGKRGVFPEMVLQNYLASLKECPHCGATYPSNRHQCPMCSASVPVATVSPDKVQVKTLLQTIGAIITWDVMGNTVRVLAHEGGKVVLHEVDKYKQTRRVELFSAMPYATYAFIGEMLVISPVKNSEQLMIVDVSGNKPAPVLQTTTAQFSGSQPMFGASARHLYRIAGGYLMRGAVEHGQLIEQSIMAISEGQTWFTVAPDSERVFGYFRAFNDYQHWLLLDRNRFEADLAPLQAGEFLIDIDVQFAKDSVLIIRQTQLNGVERVRMDEIDHKGRRMHTAVLPNATDFGAVHGHAYMRQMMLRATDTGIVQNRFDTGAVKRFKQTEPVVRTGDTLIPYEKGLLTIKDKQVVYLRV